jgi:ParB-like chromosome segregation protein Spo0J
MGEEGRILRETVIGGHAVSQAKTTPRPAIIPGRYQFMPDLPIEVFAALKADIAKRGILTPIDVDEEGNILDGHNRWRAHCESGRNEAPPVIVRSGLNESEKMAFARRQNILRRHMSREGVRRVIEGQLRDAPNRSDRSIAADLGVDHKTVATVRRAAGGEIPHLTERQGRDGKNYQTPERAQRRHRGAVPDTPEDVVKAMLGSAKAIRANAERIAALPDAVKLAMFHAGVPARSMIVMRANPFGHPPLEPSEEKVWGRYAEYLQARLGVSPEDAGEHIDWLTSHKNFRTPDEWLGEEGREYRVRQGLSEPSASFLAGWRTWLGRLSGDEAKEGGGEGRI